MKHVLTYSSYVPWAWIAAHGCEPVQIRPRGDRLHPSVSRVEGLCPYTQAWVSDVLFSEQADAIVMTTGCDQMRRAFDLVTQQTDVPCFLLNLPSVWQTDSAFDLYQEELKRLGRFLEKLEGVSEGREPSSRNTSRSKPDRIPRQAPIHDLIPLALVGSHGMTHDDDLTALIEQCGGYVALNATEPDAQPDIQGDSFDAMSRASWAAIEDVFQRPNTRLYDRLSRMIEQTPVAGVIIRRYLWCDLWHAEVHRIKAWSPVPVLDIEIQGPAQTDRQRLATRIQAFMEMIA